MFRVPKIILVLFLFAATAISQDSTISSIISVPPGYVRVPFPAGSYSHWIQSLPLKNSHDILLYNGKSVGALANIFYFRFNVFGIVKMPLLFKTDLEQCADFAMRFWAEYHKATGRLDKLYLFDYSGKRTMFSTSGKSYSRFLREAFANTNSYSLKKGCAEIQESELAPGDMFVQNQKGGIGHVSVVVDICESKEGNKLYCIGYGFMPAQEFHIEKARNEYGIDGWFTLQGYKKYLKDYLDFGTPVLRRFNPL